MKNNFDFKLPVDFIAQSACSKSDKAGLFVVQRGKDIFYHHRFRDLPGFLNKNDLLVLNNSAVIPARFWGIAEGTGQVEVTLVTKRKNNLWEAIVRPDYNLRKGQPVYFDKNRLALTLAGKTTYSGWLLEWDYRRYGKLENISGRFAVINIPFYIKRDPKPEEYQNVYAEIPGSTQCPTAGLHFTGKLLNELRKKGVDIGFITLHIGGSVLPLTTKDYNNLQVHEEYFEVSDQVSNKIKKAKSAGAKVVAVGTTVVRALESAFDAEGNVKFKKGWTALTIKPGYKFKIVDGFLTNFHLPSSSHLLLTSAFGGPALIMRSYKEAIRKKYRFLDFGDAMLII